MTHEKKKLCLRCRQLQPADSFHKSRGTGCKYYTAVCDKCYKTPQAANIGIRCTVEEKQRIIELANQFAAGSITLWTLHAYELLVEKGHKLPSLKEVKEEKAKQPAPIKHFYIDNEDDRKQLFLQAVYERSELLNKLGGRKYLKSTEYFEIAKKVLGVE